MLKFSQVAAEAQDAKREDRLRVVRESLDLVNKRLAKDFALPLDSAMRCRSIVVNECT